MTKSERKLFFDIKKLITKPDYNEIDKGLELLVKSKNNLFFEYLLQDCSIRKGVLYASPNLVVSAPRQPYMDYALWNIIGACPDGAKIHNSLKKNNLRSVKIKKYQSYYTHFHYLERFPIGITEFKNLIILEFQEAKISVIPFEISKLTNLKKMDFSKNKLEKFQVGICKLKNLKELILSNNQIDQIPNEIGDLKNIEILKLDNNKIKAIPDSIIHCKRAKFLTFANNEIRVLTNSIGHLSKVEELDLSINRLRTLPDSINNLKKLISLSVANNDLKKVPYLKLGHLISLNLSNNAIFLIPDKIKILKKLEILNLSGNRGLGVFEPGISFLDNLNILELGRTGYLKPKPQRLSLKNRSEVEAFFHLIKLRYKLVKKTKSIEPARVVKPAYKFVGNALYKKSTSNIVKYDLNDEIDVIISNLSNYLDSENSEMVDIGIDLLVNLNNQEVYNRIFSRWKITNDQLQYSYGGVYSDNAPYKYSDYCILSILTSAANNIVFPNGIKISKIKELSLDIEANRYPIFLNKLTNIEKINFNFHDKEIKNDFYFLKSLKIITLINVKKVSKIDFLMFKRLESIKLYRCYENDSIVIENQNKLASIYFESVRFNEKRDTNICIRNNPKLEVLQLFNVSCDNLIIEDCPKLKYIEIRYSSDIKSFHFENITNLNELKIVGLSLVNIMDLVYENTKLVKVILENVPIIEIKNSINKLKYLKEFRLNRSKVKILPPEIGELRSLEKLELSGNELKEIPNVFSELTELKSIDLSNQSGLTKIEDSLKDLPLELFKNPKLTSVKISWPSIILRKFESKLALANLHSRLSIITNK